MPIRIPRRFAVVGALGAAFILALVVEIGRGGPGQGGATISLTLTDQLGRSTPFFICGYNSTTKLTAKLVVTVPEGAMLSPYATFRWQTSDGKTIAQMNRDLSPVGPRTFVGESTLDVNLTTFPPAERPYSICASVDNATVALGFHICGRPDRTVLQEDFQDRPPWTLPPDWLLESQGHGPDFQYVEKLTFEGENQVLRITSYQGFEACLAHRINISAEHIKLSFKAKTWEEYSFNTTEPVVFSSGIIARGEKYALVNLGKYEVLPYGSPYSQGSWTQIEIYLDLGRSSSSFSCYVERARVGTTTLPGITPSEIEGVYFLLSGTSWYVAQIDELLFQEYGLGEGSRYYPFSATIDVYPTHGQWFDPSSFIVRYSAEITPRISSNPYLVVKDLQIELWNSTQRVSMVGRTSWDGSAEQVSSCEIFSHAYSCRLPWDLIDSKRDRFEEFKGQYTVKSVPDDPALSLAKKAVTFHVDDPFEGYFSLWTGGPRLPTTTLQRVAMNISINVEFDPSPAAGNANEPFANKTCFFCWTDPKGKILRNETSAIKSDPSYPSNRSWAFDSLQIYANSTVGTYACLVRAICNTGYIVGERYQFTLVVAEEGLPTIGTLASILIAFALGPLAPGARSGRALACKA